MQPISELYIHNQALAHSVMIELVTKSMILKTCDSHNMNCKGNRLEQIIHKEEKHDLCQPHDAKPIAAICSRFSQKYAG